MRKRVVVASLLLSGMALGGLWATGHLHHRRRASIADTAAMDTAFAGLFREEYLVSWPPVAPESGPVVPRIDGMSGTGHEHVVGGVRYVVTRERAGTGGECSVSRMTASGLVSPHDFFDAVRDWVGPEAWKRIRVEPPVFADVADGRAVASTARRLDGVGGAPGQDFTIRLTNYVHAYKGPDAATVGDAMGVAVTLERTVDRG